MYVCHTSINFDSTYCLSSLWYFLRMCPSCGSCHTAADEVYSHWGAPGLYAGNATWWSCWAVVWHGCDLAASSVLVITVEFVVSVECSAGVFAMVTAEDIVFWVVSIVAPR